MREAPPLSFRRLELAALSGVHFQPAGGLRLPATHVETPMDLLQHLVDHHVDALTAIIERAATLSDDVLDAPITTSVETIDANASLRSVVNAMVTQEEHWLSALRGGPWPDDSDRTVRGLAARHAVSGHDYRTFVAQTIAAGTLADTIVDTTCDPPRTPTLGGVIGHVTVPVAFTASSAPSS